MSGMERELFEGRTCAPAAAAARGSNGSIFRKLAPLTGEGCSAQGPSKGTLPLGLSQYVCIFS